MERKELVFATANLNKVREVTELIGDIFVILSLKDIGCEEDIPETQPTFEGNALQKARYVKSHFGLDCFSEDTGLEVEALNGDPGVFTARYGGPAKRADDNINLLLKNLENQSNRKAQFRTAIALSLDGQEYIFEGIAHGTILYSRKGDGGFGYDPVFLPDGYEESFAEMDSNTKNKISHRAKAVLKLKDFLLNYNQTNS
ncbi:MAG: non-canonical purine NTP diphosphatase [Bacteroidota bacterium]